MKAGQVCAVLAAALLLIGSAHTAQAQGGTAGGGAGMSGSPTGAQGAGAGAAPAASRTPEAQTTRRVGRARAPLIRAAPAAPWAAAPAARPGPRITDQRVRRGGEKLSRRATAGPAQGRSHTAHAGARTHPCSAQAYPARGAHLPVAGCGLREMNAWWIKPCGKLGDSSGSGRDALRRSLRHRGRCERSIRSPCCRRAASPPPS